MSQLNVLLSAFFIFISLNLKANGDLKELIIRNNNSVEYIEVDYDDNFVIFTECKSSQCYELGSVSIDELNRYVHETTSRIKSGKATMTRLFAIGSSLVLAGGVTYYGLDAKWITDVLFLSGMGSIACSVLGNASVNDMTNRQYADDILEGIRNCRSELVVSGSHKKIKQDILNLLEMMN